LYVTWGDARFMLWSEHCGEHFLFAIPSCCPLRGREHMCSPFLLGRNVDNVDPLWGFHGDNIPFYIHISLDYGEYFSTDMEIWGLLLSDDMGMNNETSRDWFSSWFYDFTVILNTVLRGTGGAKKIKTKWGVQKYGKIPYIFVPLRIPSPDSGFGCCSIITLW